MHETWFVGHGPGGRTTSGSASAKRWVADWVDGHVVGTGGQDEIWERSVWLAGEADQDFGSDRVGGRSCRWPARLPPRAERELPKVRFLLAWGKKGTEPGEFHFPIGIAIDRADVILVTDHYNHRVQRFDRDGQRLGLIPVLPNPGGIATSTAAAISISVTSRRRSAVSRSIRTGFRSTAPRASCCTSGAKAGSGPGEFNYPGGMAVAQDGRLYIADQTNHRIQVLDLNGRFLAAWGKYGTKPGEFGGNTNVRSRAGGPDFVAIDSQGNVFTTEAMDGRVQKFTPDGKFLFAFGDLKDRPGSFGTNSNPCTACTDRSPSAAIAKIGSGSAQPAATFQQFTSDGRFLRGFGEQQGTEPGRFFAPHGVALDSRGDLYVVDAYNHRIQKFDVGGN